MLLWFKWLLYKHSYRLLKICINTFSIIILYIIGDYLVYKLLPKYTGKALNIFISNSAHQYDTEIQFLRVFCLLMFSVSLLIADYPYPDPVTNDQSTSQNARDDVDSIHLACLICQLQQPINSTLTVTSNYICSAC